MNLIWKLLRSHVSWTQLTGFFLASLVGMLIVLLCVQVYSDIRPMFAEGDSFIKKDYLVVTKKVSTLGMLSKKSAVFSSEEIKDITSQPFVRSIGKFTASAFGVTAGVYIRDAGFTTEMFFESVPDPYIDIRTDEWSFNEREGMIPIIIPRNYLNLYNFGFAQSRNLPRISESVVGMLKLDIELSGNGKRADYSGRIVGFSNRLNTILVPERFMEWANTVYGPKGEREPSRLIVETANPSDKKVLDYFAAKGYEVEDGRLDSGKAMWFLNTSATIVVFIGLTICLLSLYIFMLSIYLVLQKNSTKLENLLLLGYTVNQVSRPYQNMIWILNGVILGVVVVAVIVIRSIYVRWLAGIWPEFQSGTMSLMLIVGVSLFVCVCVFNVLAVRTKIRKIAG